MQLTDTMYFSNNNSPLGTYAYIIRLIGDENSQILFEGNVIVANLRYFEIEIDISHLIKGTYKLELYIDNILYYKSRAYKVFSDNIETNEVINERLINDN